IYYYSYTLGPSSRTANVLVPRTTNTTTFPLIGNDPATSLLMASYLSRLDGNLSAVLPNIATASALNVSTFSAWKNLIAKEWFGINATYASIAVNQSNLETFVANIDTIHPLVAASFASMTPDEVMIATTAMFKPRSSFDNLWRAYYVEKGLSSITALNISAVLSWAAPFVSAANVEIAGKTSVTLNYTISIDIRQAKNTEDMATFLLWDHDNSLANYVAAKKARPLQNPGFKAFTGDEVLYMMHFYRITTSAYGSINKTSSWRYDDNSVPAALGTLIRKFTATPYLAHLLGIATGDAKATLLRSLLFGNVSISRAAGSPIEFTDASFSFAQVKVNALDMEFSLQDGLQLNKLDLWYGEHKFAGFFAYEDVNGNGIQDISVQGNAPFMYPVSAEVRYRLRIDGAAGRTLVPPTVISNGVNFGINFTGITGKLVPVDQADDAIVLDSSLANAIPVNIDAIGFMLRFAVNTTANSGNLKIDYHIGAFENASGAIEPAMNGLSLSMVSMGSMFRVLAGTRLVSNTALGNENGGGINPGSDASSRIAKIRFGSGTSLGGRVFESDLASIPYTIGTTSYGATAQMIPVLMGGIALGRSNPVGNYTQKSGVAIIGMVYLYSVNFPTWSGQALVHDPVFSTFIPSGDSPKIWLYVGITLGGVAALVIVLAVVRAKKTRASSYPGEPRAASGEAKARAGATRVDLIHSFFFHGSDPSDIDASPGPRGDASDPATFEFFASIFATRVHELDMVVQSWTTISARDIDVVPGLSGVDVARLMESGLLLSPDKYAIDINAGRAYLYHVTMGSNVTLHVLDIFTRPAEAAILRFTTCARQPIAQAGYPSIDSTMRRLLASLRRVTSRKLDKGLIDSFLDEHLPINLAYPRRLTPAAVTSFLREARQDGELSPGDLAEIESDLRKMDEASARRVSAAFKTSSASRETDAGAPGEPGR
ncbi:MAG: hypothetical protein GYA24_14440, partial [Candidatus Lokiarchaeota archaeon]|nr:hypothetical protein [Candidatus Lokiarchaeota archaeon]